MNRLHHVLFVTATGDHDKRDDLQSILLAAPGEQFQAGHFRHFPVAQNQVNRLTRQHLQGFAPVHGFLDLDTWKVIAQTLFHQITDKGCVVHYQHADFAHRPLLF